MSKTKMKCLVLISMLVATFFAHYEALELSTFDDNTVAVVQEAIKLLDQRSNSLYSHRMVAIRGASLSVRLQKAC